MKKYATAGIFVFAAIALSGCSSVGSIVDAVKDADPVVQAITANDGEWLAVGDCFNDVSEEIVDDIGTVGCDKPHDNEIYFDFTIDLAQFPGDDELTRLADEGCYAPFVGFVGLDFESSTLDYSFYTPTEDGWNNYDDRLVSCLIFDPAGEGTGSLAGSVR